MYKIPGCILLFYLVLNFNTSIVFAQTDTIATSTITPTGPVKKDRAPRKAAIRSAIIPGWGQVYNKKYWKVPIIYVAGGAATYFYITNAQVYRENRDLLKNNPDSEFADIYRINRDRFREYRDWNIAMMIGLYLLNIVDANVDAHLREFDVDDNLAFTVKPYLYRDIYNSPVTGLSLNLKFKK